MKTLLSISASFLVLSLLCGQSFAQSTCVEELGPEATLQQVIQCLDARITEQAALLRQASQARGMTSGVIVAFEGTAAKPCPDDWSLYEEATSRVIVGAGHTSDLTPKTVGERKGSEMHLHSWGASLPEDPRRVSDRDWGGTPWAGGPNPARGQAGIGGNTNEVSNIPPYVALYFCKKL